MMTHRMKQALDAITAHVGLHGVMPSRAMLAQALACNKNNANRLMQSLVERGEINSLTPGGGTDRVRSRRRCRVRARASGIATRQLLRSEFREDNGRGSRRHYAASRSIGRERRMIAHPLDTRPGRNAVPRAGVRAQWGDAETKRWCHAPQFGVWCPWSGSIAASLDARVNDDSTSQLVGGLKGPTS